MNPTVTSRAEHRAAWWLMSQGLPGVPTPLVTSRIEARRRIRLGVTLAAIALVAIVATIFILIVLDPDPGMSAWLYLIWAIALSIRGAELWMMRRVDRRIAANLPRRAARPVAHTWSAVLGRRLMTAMAVQAGSILTVAVLALAFGGRESRVAAIVMLAASAVSAAIIAGEVAHAVRRPALAEDELSVAVDELLRRVDAHRSAGSGMPMVFGMIVLGPLVSESELLALVCGAIWVAGMLAAGVLSQERPAVRAGAEPGAVASR